MPAASSTELWKSRTFSVTMAEVPARNGRGRYVAVLRVVLECADQVLVAAHDRSREGRFHGTEGVADEAVRVDVGMICDDIEPNPLQDLIGPGHMEGVQRGKSQQKVAQRRGVQRARVEKDQHHTAGVLFDGLGTGG